MNLMSPPETQCDGYRKSIVESGWNELSTLEWSNERTTDNARFALTKTVLVAYNILNRSVPVINKNSVNKIWT